jgi:hypothetical protein
VAKPIYRINEVLDSSPCLFDLLKEDITLWFTLRTLQDRELK